MPRFTHYERTLTHNGIVERETMPFNESVPGFIPGLGVPEHEALQTVNTWNRMASNAPNVNREGYVRYTYYLA